MSHSNTPTPSAGVRRLALILVAGLSLGLPLSGCDQESETAQAIQSATLDLQSLVPGGVQPPSPSYRQEVYNRVVSSLGKVQGTKSESAAAGLLLSQAHAGLADAPANTAAILERQSLNAIASIQAELGTWFGHNALADAAASYDPAKELADIDAQVKDRQEKRIAAQNQKSQVDAQVAQLQAQAKAKLDQAKAKQQEAGALRSQVANQTAVQGEQTLKQAQGVSRQADALEVEAATLDAEAAKIAPQSASIQLEIDRLSNQADLLAKAKGDVQKRFETAKANAAASRADAAKAAEAIKQQVAALEAIRSGDLEKAASDAAAGYTAAAAAAGKAISESRISGQMAVGAAQQSLGDVHWTKAHGLNSYAQLLETLAAAKPALPDSAAYAAKAAEARAAAKAALDAATEAYKAADAAYRASGSPDAQERVERLGELLAKAVDKTSDGSVDIRPAKAEGGEAAPAATGEPAAAVDPDSPQATLQAVLDASNAGDFEKLLASMHFASDADRQAMTAIFSIAPKFKKLEDAMQAKFGQGLGAMAGQAMPAGASGGMDQFKNAKVSDFQVTVEGETAQVIPPGGEPMKMVRQDGKWLIDASAMGGGVDPQQMAMAQAMLPALGKAAEDLAAEIEAGKYETAEAAMAAFQQKIMGAMMPGGGR